MMNISVALLRLEACSRPTHLPSACVYLSNQPRSQHQAAAAVSKHAVMRLLNTT